MRRFLLLLGLAGWPLLAACGARTTGLSEADFAAVPGDDAGRDTSLDSTLPETGFDARPPPFDSRPPIDTGFPPPPDSAPPPLDGGPTDHTVGDPCTSDGDCDKTGAGVNRCSSGTFGEGSLYPNPVCLGIDCDPGDGTTLARCDADKGICLSTGGGGGGSGGICLGICSFDESGAPPKGCAARDACNYFTLDHLSDGTTVGYGYCFGGCFADSDCTGGDRCQKETGLCVRRLTAFAKKVGDACTSADVMKVPNACNCLYTTPTNKGYCSTFCELGVPGCPTGYTCDAFLPKTDPFTGGPAFTAGPKGLGGYCMKDCATDADCAALNGYCDENGGTGRKTCQPGTRP